MQHYFYICIVAYVYEHVTYTYIAQANDIVSVPAVLGVVLGRPDPVLDDVVLDGVVLGGVVLGGVVLGSVVLVCIVLGGVVLLGAVLGRPINAKEPVTRTSASEVKVYT